MSLFTEEVCLHNLYYRRICQKQKGSVLKSCKMDSNLLKLIFKIYFGALFTRLLLVVLYFKSIIGGVVTAGLAIYDTMQYILNPISTWCVGQAASMGSLLLASGTAGMRHSLPNARIMVHQPSGGARVRMNLRMNK